MQGYNTTSVIRLGDSYFLVELVPQRISTQSEVFVSDVHRGRQHTYHKKNNGIITRHLYMCIDAEISCIHSPAFITQILSFTTLLCLLLDVFIPILSPSVTTSVTLSEFKYSSFIQYLVK